MATMQSPYRLHLVARDLHTSLLVLDRCQWCSYCVAHHDTAHPVSWCYLWVRCAMTSHWCRSVRCWCVLHCLRENINSNNVSTKDISMNSGSNQNNRIRNQNQRSSLAKGCNESPRNFAQLPITSLHFISYLIHRRRWILSSMCRLHRSRSWQCHCRCWHDASCWNGVR